jgi:hypothetical protein
MRIIVLGYIIRGPLGGLCPHHFQYLLGFKKMGHEVLFLEDSDSYASCYNPDTHEMTTDPTYGINFITELFKKYDLENSWAYFDEHSGQWYGQSQKKVFEFCASADLVVNISHVNPLRDWWLNIPTRILIDTDPAFTQIRHLDDDAYSHIAKQHTHFFTFGENFGKPGCSIPDDGFAWKPTRQPVVFDMWELAQPRPEGKWSTVMSWDSYKVRKHGDITYGMKSASFTEYMQLPTMTSEDFELAIGANPPRERLREAGWKVEGALAVTRTVDNFRNFISNSKGEWSIAKQGYVVCDSGWFSERSCSYLAMGRPVIVQNTGFDQVIETGRGLFAFSSPAESVTCLEEVTRNYDRHCEYAREVAHSFFDSKMVLGEMLRQL